MPPLALQSPEHALSRTFQIQGRISSRVTLEDSYSLNAVAGVDQAFVKNLVISGAVVLGKSMEVIDRASCGMMAAMPYVPGLLSFREGPPAIKAVRALENRPTLLFVDGCGINHPRKAGLASYLGVILGLPTIGVSKNVLCGEFQLPEKAGESSPLVFKGDVVGHLLKSKKGCRPIVVAPGHRVSLDSALELARKFLKGHKLPEPCRLAHEYAGTVKADLLQAQGASL